MTVQSGIAPVGARLFVRSVAFVFAMGLGVSAASAGTVTVKKILMPAGDTGTFTLQLKNSGGSVVASLPNVGGGAQLGPVTVAAGTYTVNEVGFGSTNLANYTRTFSGGCSQTPAAPGAVVTVTATSNTICTITNTRIPAATGTLKLKKVLVPANDPGHFNLAIKNSANVVVSSMANAGNNQSAGPVTVPTGIYTVSEAAGFATVGTDYTSVISGPGCNPNGTVNVTAGSNITCTITNTKNPAGTIKVIKNTVPSNIPGALFTLKINNSNGQTISQWSNGHPSPLTMGPVSLTSGSTYTVTELGGTGTNLSNYTTTFSASCPNGVVNLTAGAAVVCTITNTLITPPCTGYPMLATVNINNPMSPFGPQTVDICRGGKVKFVNNNSGAAHTINYLNGPSPFGSLSLPAANGSSVQTIALPNVGTDNYLIAGFTVQGHIIVH